MFNLFKQKSVDIEYSKNEMQSFFSPVLRINMGNSGFSMSRLSIAILIGSFIKKVVNNIK